MSLGLLLQLWCLLVFVNVASTDVCPLTDMFAYRGICYKYVSTKMSWADAEPHCVSEGLHLAILDDDIAVGLRKYIVDNNFAPVQHINLQTADNRLWLSGGGDGVSAYRWSTPGGRVTPSGPRVPTHLLRTGAELYWQSSWCLGLAASRFASILEPNQPYSYQPCSRDNPVLCQEGNIKKIELFNVIYQTDTASVVSRPASSKVTVITNNSDEPQESTRVITFSYGTSKDWGHRIGASANVELTVKSGIPYFAEAEVKVGLEANYAHTWGTGETETKTDQIRATVRVPAKSRQSVWVSYKENTIDIPYTASVKVHHNDGTSIIKKEQHSGVFKGVDAAEFHIMYGDTESLE